MLLEASTVTTGVVPFSLSPTRNRPSPASFASQTAGVFPNPTELCTLPFTPITEVAADDIFKKEVAAPVEFIVSWAVPVPTAGKMVAGDCRVDAPPPVPSFTKKLKVSLFRCVELVEYP
jgi:hypothetical protein